MEREKESSLSSLKMSSYEAFLYQVKGLWLVAQILVVLMALISISACPVSFEFKNYTIITSQCKGPLYPPNRCCPAFKEFACPYADVLNDLSNNCAATMFSYINLKGNYSAGLFGTLCQDDKQGLICPATAPTQSTNSSSGSQIVRNPSLLLVLTTVLLVVVL